MKKIFLFFCLIVYLFYDLWGQEIEISFSVNPVLVQQYRQMEIRKMLMLPSANDTLALPFKDDFAKEGFYPDTSLWLDRNVFINRDYPVSPPTLGVATFDGVGSNGKPYNILAAATSSLPADTLTSKPINLAGLPADSSVILSFFWQASSFNSGRGNDPEPSDTLLLEFKNPLNDSCCWKTVWFQNGYNPSPPDTDFHMVMLPIADTAYLKNGFQFRFRNYATVSGNVDHWHLDYVFLDKQRNMGDSIFDDVTFVYNAPSLLKNYSAMPWEQYNASEMKTNFALFIRNNYNVKSGNSFIPKNTLVEYKIFNSSGSTEATYTGGSQNIYPFDSVAYWNYSPHTNPPVGTNVPGPSLTPYSYPALTDTATFLLQCMLNTSPDAFRFNDTLRLKQKLHNYFAYDDGTAESGYGLNVFGGKIAYKFSLNVPDTLVAVQMLFNWIVNNVSNYTFKITVWDDNGAGGKPGTVLFQDGLVTPQYAYDHPPDWGNETNVFYNYPLSAKVALPAGGFYVGWEQTFDQLLNLGVDKNTNSNSKMFFDAGSGWTQSSIKGSWMMRPVFKDTALYASVQEIFSGKNSIVIFPNPTFGKFAIKSSVQNISGIELFTVYGEKVFEAPTNRQTANNEWTNMDVSHLPGGMYILKCTVLKGRIFSEKLFLLK